MYYITVADLIKCIGSGKNLGALSTICIQYTALSNKYKDIKNEILIKECEKKDDKISDLNQKNRTITQQLDELLERTGAIINQNDDLHGKVDTLHEQNVELLDGQLEMHKTIVNHQQQLPAQGVDLGRSPHMAVTYFLYVNDDNEMIIRILPVWGMFNNINNTVIELLTGKYGKSGVRNRVVNQQLAIAPVYAPDQRNWINNAKKTYNGKIKEMKKILRAKLKSCKSQLTSINKPNLSLKYAPNLEKENISIIEHLLARERSLNDENQDEETHETNIKNLETRLREANKHVEKLNRDIETFTNQLNDEIPIKFNKAYIDFQTNRHITLKDIFELFTDAIIQTHGKGCLKNINDQVLEASVNSARDFKIKFTKKQLKDKKRLQANAKQLQTDIQEILNDVTKKLSNEVALAVIGDDD